MPLINNEKSNINLMSHLENLQTFALVTTGRTGTDFLQSLLDSHTEVLTFNGQLYFHDFWRKSKCANLRNVRIEDLLDEFIGIHLEKFKSRYDHLERKDCLGINGDESVDIDLNIFKYEASKLLINRKITSRNVMLAIYGAYAISLGQNLKTKKIIFHHIHHVHRIPQFLADFPDSKIISMTRDPRANFVSGITHWRKYNENTDNASHLFFYIKRIIIDAYALEKFDNKEISIKIEDLGKKCVLEALCKWMGIQFEKTLNFSTWGGLRWRGDRVSDKQNSEPGWSSKMLDNSWDTKLSFLDKYILNILLNDRLKHYGYNYNVVNFYDYLILPFLIVMPLRFEARYFTISYIKNNLKNRNYKNLLKNIIYYPARVKFFYVVMLTKMMGFKFSCEYINCD
jgi:hypothetical protein